VLAEGDIVSGDARLLDAAGLLADESALTGESAPAEKAPADDENDRSEDRLVSAGTVITRGRGLAVVTAIGTSSAMGRVAALVGERPGLTPLQHRLAGIGRALAIAAAVLCAIVLAIGLVEGQPAELMVITAISLVVAAVPDSLPAVVTLALALGARRMSARNALIRRLPVVETLGSVTVLATDKTGTLTEGTMVTRRLWTSTGDAEVSGSGYGPDGEVTRGPRRLCFADAPDITSLLTQAALCTDAAAKLGLDPAELKARFPRVAELPFDSARKRMTTAHRLPAGGVLLICKGAPEAVLSAAAATENAGAIDRATARAEQLAAEGFRVLAVAAADLPCVPPGPYGLPGGLAEILVMLTGPFVGLALPLLPRPASVDQPADPWPSRGCPRQRASRSCRHAPPAAPACRKRAGRGTLAAHHPGRRRDRGGRHRRGLVGPRHRPAMAEPGFLRARRHPACGRRWLTGPPRHASNPALLVAIAGALALQFAGLYLPFLRDLLHTRPLTATDLLVVVALSTLGYAAIRLDRVVHR
jgi:magnesium-transporting ATPase (P-type)